MNSRKDIRIRNSVAGRGRDWNFVSFIEIFSIIKDKIILIAIKCGLVAAGAGAGRIGFLSWEGSSLGLR